MIIRIITIIICYTVIRDYFLLTKLDVGLNRAVNAFLMQNLVESSWLDAKFWCKAFNCIRDFYFEGSN